MKRRLISVPERPSIVLPSISGAQCSSPWSAARWHFRLLLRIAGRKWRPLRRRRWPDTVASGEIAGRQRLWWLVTKQRPKRIRRQKVVVEAMVRTHVQVVDGGTNGQGRKPSKIERTKQMEAGNGLRRILKGPLVRASAGLGMTTLKQQSIILSTCIFWSKPFHQGPGNGISEKKLFEVLCVL